MIKIVKHSKQKVSKDDILTDSDFLHTVRVFGIKLYENTQTAKTSIEDGFGEKGSRVGFSSKK